ncbi:hypothetical protein [Streptomyces tritici]|uniref:hypothetical protein n=1 Tax=Streptomyces tritici TaxID=2054410 RepID=UPI003AEFEC5D
MHPRWSEDFRPRPDGDARIAGPARTEAGARAAFLGRQAGAGADPAELLERAAAAADPRTGLFAAVPDAEPGPAGLWACGISVLDPFGVLPDGTPGVLVPGYGGAARSARLDAVLGALAVSGTFAAVAHARRVREVWGLDLVTGRLRRVPAAEAYAAPAPGAPFRPLPGAAAGLTWGAAVETALTRHCEELVAHRLAEPGARVPRLALPGDADAPLRALRDLGEPVAHDLSALLSVPACAIRLPAAADRDGGTGTVVAVGATRTEAVATAVRRALILGAGPSVPAGSAVPCVPAVTREQEAPGPPVPAERGTPGRTGFVEALRARGRTPVAVLLDHDPRAVRLLPYLVQVVLTED